MLTELTHDITTTATHLLRLHKAGMVSPTTEVTADGKRGELWHIEEWGGRLSLQLMQGDDVPGDAGDEDGLDYSDFDGYLSLLVDSDTAILIHYTEGN